jgi:hypothetical protein
MPEPFRFLSFSPERGVSYIAVVVVLLNVVVRRVCVCVCSYIYGRECGVRGKTIKKRERKGVKNYNNNKNLPKTR